jgi:uncharacterized protein YdhG (YjbR/CyaY superfamily)
VIIHRIMEASSAASVFDVSTSRDANGRLHPCHIDPQCCAMTMFDLLDVSAGLVRLWDTMVAVLDRVPSSTDNGVVSSEEITSYLDALDEPKRTTLQKLREIILDVIPEAEQGLSYKVPAFKLHGKVVAGFAAFQNHLSYLPFSGSVFPELKEDLVAYSTSKGALRFAIDEPLPKELVEKLIKVRISQLFRG